MQAVISQKNIVLMFTAMRTSRHKNKLVCCSAPRDGERCEPGRRFVDECNMCICSQDGIKAHASCTINICRRIKRGRATNAQEDAWTASWYACSVMCKTQHVCSVLLFSHFEYRMLLGYQNAELVIIALFLILFGTRYIHKCNFPTFPCLLSQTW